MPVLDLPWHEQCNVMKSSSLLRLVMTVLWMSSVSGTPAQTSSGPGSVASQNIRLTVPSLSQLPLPVQNTIRGQAGTVPISQVNAVTNNGQITYDVAFKRAGQNVQLRIAPNGEIVSGLPPANPSPERVALSAPTKIRYSDLPIQVRRSVQSIAASAPILDVTKGTVQGRVVYQVSFQKSGRNEEVRMAEDGSLVRDALNDRFVAQEQL
jgi:hypothetical protein